MIGIFGGTFDPIHYGHLRPALDVLERLELDEIRFVPAHLPPHKTQPERSSSARAAMVAAAIADEPRFVLDDCELKRHRTSYSVETLIELRERLGSVPLVCIMGSDAFDNLPRWHRWEALLDLAHIAVMERPGELSEPLDFPAGYIEQREITEVEALRRCASGSILRVPVTRLDISATDIRDRLARSQSVRYLLPDPLIATIKRHQYYR